MENYLLILILCTSIILLFVGCTILKINEGFSKWEKTNSTACKKIRVEGKRIYKLYSSPKKVISIQDLYDRYLVHFPFVPRMKFDVYNNIIIEDYYDVPLTKKTKPKDYISQLWKIHHQIQNAGLYHNDYKPRHFFVDNNQIKLIDWDRASQKENKKTRNPNKMCIVNDMNHLIENLDS